MKLITVAGLPSSGKTSVILNLSRILRECGGLRSGVVKLGCRPGSDVEDGEKGGNPVEAGFPEDPRQDRFSIRSAEEILRWAFSRNLDLLAVESAGPCSPCFPRIREAPGICVIDNSDCSRFADTTVPLLKAADAVAITKGDTASPEDREALSRYVRKVNSKAGIVFVNGVTGQGTVSLLRHLRFPETDDLQERPDLCGGRRSGPASRPLVFSKKESGNVGIDPAGNGAMTG